jgi:hypothetical protein
MGNARCPAFPRILPAATAMVPTIMVPVIMAPAIMIPATVIAPSIAIIISGPAVMISRIVIISGAIIARGVIASVRIATANRKFDNGAGGCGARHEDTCS